MTQDQSTRREWFRTAARLGSLVGIGAFSTYLLTRPVEGGDCVQTLPCRSCSAWNHCTLPKADSARSFDEFGGQGTDHGQE